MKRAGGARRGGVLGWGAALLRTDQRFGDHAEEKTASEGVEGGRGVEALEDLEICALCACRRTMPGSTTMRAPPRSRRRRARIGDPRVARYSVTRAARRHRPVSWHGGRLAFIAQTTAAGPRDDARTLAGSPVRGRERR